MKTTILLCIAVLLLASCGGGNGPSGPSHCDVSSASSGETVVCSVEGFEEDCTCFVGRTPTDCELTAEGQIEITIPPSAIIGTFDLTYACGARGPTTIQKDFSIVRRGTGTSCETDSDCSEGEICREGECLPDPWPILGCAADSNCSEGKVCREGRCVEEDGPDPTPECLANSDCSEGEVCDDGTCIPQPLEEPLQVSFVTSGSSKTEALHDTKVGAVRLKWQIRGDYQQAYIYGPFNRLEGEGCGKEGDRFLAVNSIGDELVEGSPNYTIYQGYLTGEACDAGNCHNYTPQAGDPTICKIDLMDRGTGGRFYTRFLKKRAIDPENVKFVLVAQGVDGAWQVAEQTFEAPAPEINNVTVEVRGDSPLVHVQFSYRYALTVGLDGCESETPWSSPPVNPDGELVNSNGTVNVVACQLTTKVMAFTMTVGGIDPAVNRKREIYQIELGIPTVTITNGALHETGSETLLCSAGDDEWWKDCDHVGDLQLYARATRTATVKRILASPFIPYLPPSVETVSTTNVPWVESLEVRAFAPDGTGCGSVGPLTVPYSGEWPAGLGIQGDKLMTIAKLRRDHGCTSYDVVAGELGPNGSPHEFHATASFPYEPYFEEISIPETLRRECSFTHECDYLALSQGACGDEGDADRCDHGGDGPGGCDTWDHDVDYKTEYRAQFRGRHLKGIQLHCDLPGSPPNEAALHQEDLTPELEGNSYQEQIFMLRGRTAGRKIGCTMRVTAYDGRESEIPVSWEDCPEHHYPGEE